MNLGQDNQRQSRYQYFMLFLFVATCWALDKCPPCFNCHLPSFPCLNWGNCSEIYGHCTCPDGFGSPDCSQPCIYVDPLLEIDIFVRTINHVSVILAGRVSTVTFVTVIASVIPLFPPRRTLHAIIASCLLIETISNVM
jgi:hypothetical protein